MVLYLGAGDGAVLAVRRCLMNSLREFMADKVPELARHEAIDYSGATPKSMVVEGTQDWRAML